MSISYTKLQKLFMDKNTNPAASKKAVDKLGDAIIPQDTVIEELKIIAENQNIESEDISIAMAVYMLGFGEYEGFEK